MKQRYVSILRRRRETKTDYRKRKSIIISRMPFVSVNISGKNAERVLRLVEELEDNDDVQNVYSNFDIDKQELEKIEA